MEKMWQIVGIQSSVSIYDNRAVVNCGCEILGHGVVVKY